MSADPTVLKPSARRFAVRVCKLAISLFYFAWKRGQGLWRRWEGMARPGTCVVLYYHTVPGVYRKHFEEQMNLVAAHGAVIDVSSINALQENTNAVAITFDDGLESFAENAVPVLARLGIPATVFAVADTMGTYPVWGEGYFSTDERVMTIEKLRNLPGNITVGSHSVTHSDLVKLDPSSMCREIEESRERLEKMLGREVPVFSFPFGSYNESVVQACRKAGYKRTFTTEPVVASADRVPFVCGRVAADPWDWPLEFRLKIAGAYSWQARGRPTQKHAFVARLQNQAPLANRLSQESEHSADRA